LKAPHNFIRDECHCTAAAAAAADSQEPKLKPFWKCKSFTVGKTKNTFIHAPQLQTDSFFTRVDRRVPICCILVGDLKNPMRRILVKNEEFFMTHHLLLETEDS
jgi:hypothetical protein